MDEILTQVRFSLHYCILLERVDQRKTGEVWIVTVLANETTHNRCYITGSTKRGRLKTLSNNVHPSWYGLLVQWHDSRFGCERSWVRLPDRPKLLSFLVINGEITMIYIQQGAYLSKCALHWMPAAVFRRVYTWCNNIHINININLENLVDSSNCRYGWDIYSIFPSFLCFLLGFS